MKREEGDRRANGRKQQTSRKLKLQEEKRMTLIILSSAWQFLQKPLFCYFKAALKTGIDVNEDQ